MGIIVPDIFAELCAYSGTRSAVVFLNGGPGQAQHKEEMDLPVSDDAPEPGAANTGTSGGASVASDQQAAALQEMATLMGSVAWLMTQSPAHKFIFLGDLEWMLAPAIALRQFRVYRQQGRPIAIATWAFVDEERENRLKAGQVRLAPAEWRCGDRVWLYDLIAPFGGGDNIVRDIRHNVFPDRPVRTVQISPDGKERVTVEWPPAGPARAGGDAANAPEADA
jgi:cytolysin-activating lysine-acyltransferase